MSAFHLQAIQSNAVEVERNLLVQHFEHITETLDASVRKVFVQYLRSAGWKFGPQKDFCTKGKIRRAVGQDQVERVEFLRNGQVIYYRITKAR